MSKLNIEGIIDDVIEYKKYQASWPDEKVNEVRAAVVKKLIEFEKVKLLTLLEDDKATLEDFEVDCEKEMEKILDSEPLNHLVRWLEEGAMDVFDFHRYCHTWIVTTSNSENGNVTIKKIYASENQIREYLCKQIEEDRKGCIVDFLEGTESPKDVSGENEDTILTAYAKFSNSDSFTNYYTAQMECTVEVENLSEGGIAVKKFKQAVAQLPNSKGA